MSLTKGMIIAGRYRIEELIGSGGMANVYKAYDSEAGRTVAVKVLREEHSDDADFLRRFEREARAVLTLSHPNIVKSFDVGEENGISYIVLEYVEGGTLKELIKAKGALPPRQAVHIASQILDALTHAHANGIIHRDVKPQNVILTPAGVAKLADFGIARDADATTRTFAGANVIGSVHYISPEQARGDAVTAESDIYSLGITLYEMLTGQVPFAGDNTVTVALKHLQEDMVPPIKINTKLPRALSDVVVKAAAKEPQNRYHTAQAMRQDINRALKEPHGSFAREAGQSTSKKRISSGKLLAIAISLIAVIGLFTAMFFIARAWSRDSEESAADVFKVPTLTGKPLDEAEQLAALRGFAVTVTGYLASDEMEEGYVLTQTPASGANGHEGDSINVVVSTGNDYAVVPNVTGLMLADGILALSDEDLNFTIVEYVQSEAPEGQIVQQSPTADTQIFENDYVELWISGSPEQNVELESVTGKTLDDALTVMFSSGFSRIWVRTITPESSDQEGLIIRQNPAPGTAVTKTMTVELWLGRTFQGAYSADVALNIDISETEKPVVVTARLDSGAEVVLYEATLPVGVQQSVSFTAYAKVGGEYPIIVYVNGEEVRHTTANFSLH